MKKKANNNITLEEAIIDLYLNVKLRKQEEVSSYLIRLKILMKAVKRKNMKN